MEQHKIRVAQIIGKCAEGGVESMIINLYRHIDKSKVVFDFFVENESILINKEEIQKYGGDVKIVPKYSHVFKFISSLKHYFKSNKYDIVHANMNAQSFIPLYVAKKCGIPVRIAHSHTTSNKKENIRYLVKSTLRIFSKKYPTHFVACSDLAGKWLYGNKFFETGNVQIINNGIDFNIFKFNQLAREKIRNKLNLKDDEILIGHIGRYSTQKNQPFLLNFFNEISKRNSKYKLCLIGSGNSQNEIESIIQKHGLENKIILTGPISNPFDYYNAFDCFVLPSLYEGLPVVGVEAQVNGLKCFFSDQITEEAKLLQSTQFLPINEAKCWSDTIIKFFDDNKLNNRNVVVDKKFDINSSAEKLLELYEKAIKKDK